MIRPFFSFYGGKWRDTPRHYPAPSHSTIVEPFAGGAGYSLRFPDLDVVICDIDPVITGVWRYLIGASSSDILSLPDVDGCVDDLAVCQEARWLIGFWLNRAAAAPRKKPSAWMRSGVRPGSFWGPRVRERIAGQLSAIRHWRVIEGDYTATADLGTAAWFVDPPYEGAGSHYVHGCNAIDYGDLAAFCRARRGQIIVCENHGAAWLPFSLLRDVKTARSKRSAEAVWLMTTKSHRIEVIGLETREVIHTVECSSERAADQAEMGMLRSMDLERFCTHVVGPDD